MAGAYITTSDLDTALPVDVQERRSTAQLTAQTERVNADFDQALTQAGYELPITDGITAAIKGKLTDLGRYRLALELQLLPEPADESGFYLDAKAALAWLDDVRAGRIQLDLTDSSSDGPGEIATPSIATQARRYWERW